MQSLAGSPFISQRVQAGIPIGIGLILILSQWTTLYAWWLLNRAFISYADVLVGIPDAAVEQSAHESMQQAYLQATYYEPGVQQEMRFRLLPLWMSGEAPRAESICPPSQEAFLFIGLLGRARVHMQTQNSDEADSLYKWLASSCPNSFEIWMDWAILKEMVGDYTTGISMLETAVTLEPQLVPPGVMDRPRTFWRGLAVAGAYADLGDLLAKNRQLGQAVVILEHSVALHPPGTVSPWLYQYLGILYYQIGELDKARLTLEAALAIKPDLPDAPRYLKQIEGKQ